MTIELTLDELQIIIDSLLQISDLEEDEQTLLNKLYVLKTAAEHQTS